MIAWIAVCDVRFVSLARVSISQSHMRYLVQIITIVLIHCSQSLAEGYKHWLSKVSENIVILGHRVARATFNKIN
jgi:hypothetical protein